MTAVENSGSARGHAVRGLLPVAPQAGDPIGYRISGIGKVDSGEPHKVAAP
jgi:hypothetical protein